VPELLDHPAEARDLAADATDEHLGPPSVSAAGRQLVCVRDDGPQPELDLAHEAPEGLG
jgi:hypothetical protein